MMVSDHTGQQKYLNTAMQAILLTDPMAIWIARGDFLNKPDESERAVAATSLRLECREVMEKIAHDFWQCSESEVQFALGEIEVDQFPELQNWALRLTAVNSQRNRIAELGKIDGTHPELLSAFQEILVVSGREATRLKDYTLSAILKRDSRSVKKTALSIKELLPEHYQDHSSWLNKFVKFKQTKALRERFSLRRTILTWVLAILLTLVSYSMLGIFLYLDGWFGGR